jgi:hypothetical protein
MAGGTIYTTNRTRHLDNLYLSNWVINPPLADCPATCPAKLQRSRKPWRPVPTEGGSRVKPHLNKRTQIPNGWHGQAPCRVEAMRRRKLDRGFVKTNPKSVPSVKFYAFGTVVSLFVKTKPNYPCIVMKNAKQTQFALNAVRYPLHAILQNKANYLIFIRKSKVAKKTNPNWNPETIKYETNPKSV